jgi:hypothetical protein
MMVHDGTGADKGGSCEVPIPPAFVQDGARQRTRPASFMMMTGALKLLRFFRFFETGGQIRGLAFNVACALDIPYICIAPRPAGCTTGRDLTTNAG